MLPICIRPERVWPKLSSTQGIRANLVYIVSLIKLTPRSWHSFWFLLKMAKFWPKLCKHFSHESTWPSYNGTTPFHNAAYMGHYEICKLIINSVEEKNPKNVNCTTPLHEAVYNCHLNICKLIISTAVAQKNPANYQGITPLHIASLNGHCEMCKLIIF